MVVAKLFIAGDHTPPIPLSDVVGNAARVDPLQIGGTWLKVGTTIGFTVIVIVVEVTHELRVNPVGKKV